MTLDNVRNALCLSGISPGDVLMIHGDAIVAAQLTHIGKDMRLAALIEEIIAYLGDEGTLVIPTFTYSFTKSEIFDVQLSPSMLGQFSESFRLMDGTVRSRHPIFSVSAIGKYKYDFEQCGIEDCFGDESCFGVLHRLNGKLMNQGCEFMMTYLHYVEQKCNVGYRYSKIFSGTIKDNEDILSVSTEYFVGDQNVDYTMDLSRLRERLVSDLKLRVIPFGRLASYTVGCHDFFNASQVLLAEDEYALVKESIDG